MIHLNRLLKGIIDPPQVKQKKSNLLDKTCYEVFRGVFSDFFFFLD